MDPEALGILDDLNTRAAAGDTLLVASDVMAALLDADLVVPPDYDSDDRHVRYRGKTRVRTVPAMKAGTVALMAGGQVVAPVEASGSWLEQEFLSRSGPGDPLRVRGSVPAEAGFSRTYPLAGEIAAPRPPGPPPPPPVRPRKRQRRVDV